MDLDTQEKTLLHPDGRNGDWAPDSEWVAFNVGPEIFKININGTELTKLIEANGFFEPSWSPKNDLIYFGGNEGAGIVKANGADIEFIVELGGQGSWHPSGNKIISSKGYYSNSIWRQFPVYNITDHKIEKIHDVLMKEKNEYPKYSQDGSRILFNNDRGIYIMNSDGSSITRIVPSDLRGENRKDKPELYAAFPSWHPNSREIVYEHFCITKSRLTSNGILVEGVINFIK